MKKLNVPEWHKRSKQDRENVEDDERSGRPAQWYSTGAKWKSSPVYERSSLKDWICIFNLERWQILGSSMETSHSTM